jgi:hypothetical protein
VNAVYSSAMMPAQPSTKLSSGRCTRSSGTSAMSAPTPNCHMRPNVTKYAGAGLLKVNQTLKRNESTLTIAIATTTPRRRASLGVRPRNALTPSQAASSMISGQST